jgi:plasmid maintenance system antidote protein VapI
MLRRGEKNMQVDPADLRAEIARRQVVLYKLAAEIHVHPGRLGMMLGGKIPLPRDVADKIAANLKKGSGERGR